MKTYKKQFIIFCCIVVLFSNLFMCYTTPVFAKPTLDADGHLHVYNWDDIKDSAVDWVMYMASMAGAIFADHDFAKYVQNKDSWVDYWTEDNVVISENGTSVTFSQDIMAFIKQCIDEYAKQHEPYTLYQTIPLSRISYVSLGEKKNVYDSMKNLLADSPSGIIGVSYNWINDTFRFTDIGSHFKDVGLVRYYYNGYNYQAEVKAYDIETWNHATYPRYEIVLGSEDAAIENKEDFISRATTTYTAYSEYIRFYCLVGDADMEALYRDKNCISSGNQVANFLLSNDTRRIRVYNTYADFQDYTLGKRSVYYTKEYYSYVPEDLTTSIDDLQDSVDDLSKVIDDLLDQISKDTDESEIEDLLRQILDELKNQQGTGGGGGSGDGDVTVNVDMTQTNTWLAKIYAKVAQIFDRMDSAVEDAEQAALANIQKSLDEIITQLKKIKRWAAVDTVIDGVDAVADWLDLIRGVISDADEGAESAVTAIAEALDDSAGLIRTKFPFSIPWDLFFLISFFSAEPEVPYFEIPFRVPYYDFEYTFIVDFSDYQWLSDVIRPILLMSYAIGLLTKTPSILSIGREE